MHTPAREAPPKPRTNMQKIGHALRLSKKFSREYDDFGTATASRFGENIKIVFRWKRSIYCLIWKEFLVYMSLYIFITIVHDFALTNADKQHFEDLAAYCSKFVSSLQLVLLLGFFTSTAMQRWFSLVNSIPGTSKVTAYFVNSLKENQPDGEAIVQQYARWIVLSWALVFRLVCPGLKEAYPDLMSLQNEGLLLEHERLRLEMEPSIKNHSLIVVNWNLGLLRVCARRGMYYVPADYTRNLDCLMLFKKNCNNTIKFATKNIPHALIQVVTIAVYAYGLASLMARMPSKLAPDGRWESTVVSFVSGYFPVANFIPFFLFYSWLKFGRMASYPFGEDKDDIDVKQLLYSHIEGAIRLQSIYVEASPIEKVVMTSIRNPSHIWIEHAKSRMLEERRNSFGDIELTK
ncbi:bestrophin-4-like [Daphnia carinata]|uniref:bestrophin-4-like n=1 Tax=Daphnia carinata TaxID=120202 RepID=UPI00257F70C9|nr:bestrophin-4-like [Daphnia carinata]